MIERATFRARDIGAGAAHVEGEDAGFAAGHCEGGGTGHATGGTAEETVAGPEGVGGGEPTGTSQETERDFRAHGAADVGDEAGHDRSEGGIDDGGLGARQEADDRGEFAADGDGGEAGRLENGGDGAFVGGIHIAVGERDGGGTATGGSERGSFASESVAVEGNEDIAGGVEAFSDLDDFAVERGVAVVAEGEEIGAALVADDEEIGESSGNEEDGTSAGAFEEGVGGERGGEPVFHGRKGGGEGRAGEQAGTDDRGGFAGGEFEDVARGGRDVRTIPREGGVLPACYGGWGTVSEADLPADEATVGDVP